MEKELYYTNNKLIKIKNMYFDLSPSQLLDIITISFSSYIIKSEKNINKQIGQKDRIKIV